MSKKTRYIIPNFFTGLNFLMGIFSILITTSFYHNSVSQLTLLGRAPLILAAWMVVWCVLLDKLDGFAAKLMNASSGFGAQFDSLADLIAFCVAPAFLVFYFLAQYSPEWHKAHLPLLLVSVSVYVLCGSMRLARFNAVDVDELGNYFHGLPTTFAGGFIAVIIITFEKWGYLGTAMTINYILPLMLIFLGLLMVSPLYLPKLVKRKNKWMNLIQPPLVAIGYICGFGMVLPEYFFIICVVYILGGFSYCWFKRADIDFLKA